MRRGALVLIVLLTLLFGGVAASWAPWDQPFGLDTVRFLDNARAWSEGDWMAWHRWRWPLHALLLRIGPDSTPIVLRAHLISLVSILGVVAAVAALLWRRVGPLAALQGVVLLFAFPDLVVFARMTTAYPLMAALVMLSAFSGRVQPLALGLLAAVDPRGALLGAVLLAPSLLDRQVRPVLLGLLALSLGHASAFLLPADIVPLWQQVQDQKDTHPARLPHIVDRLRIFGSPALVLVVGSALFGVGKRSSGLALLVGMGMVGGLVAFAPHRYMLPLWGPLVVLSVMGLQRAKWPVARWVGIAVVFVAWQLHPYTLRDKEPLPEGITLALRDIDLQPGEAVLDCARGYVELRLPSTVEVRKRGCHNHLKNGGKGLWVIARDGPHSPRWTEVGRYPGAGRPIVLLHEPLSATTPQR